MSSNSNPIMNRLSRAWSDEAMSNSSEASLHLSFIVLGATGSISQTKTFPALFKLFSAKLLPQNSTFIGYTRTDKTNDAFRQRVRAHLGAGDKEAFLERVFCFHGEQNEDDMPKLDEFLCEREQGKGNRVFYFNIPKEIVKVSAEMINKFARAKAGGWCRLILEKPLGRTYQEVEDISAVLDGAVGEENVFRMDHYMGKEIVQNILALRFGNTFLESSWNNNYIEAVHIQLTEDFLVRDGAFAEYFDEYGVVHDLVMDHLLSLMCLVAMEPPISRHAEDVRNERVKVLRSCQAAKMENMVLGQYEGYQDHDRVPSDSVTPTFASCVLFVDNARWWGVPFILTAGKAMDKKRSQVAVQFKRPSNLVYEEQAASMKKNELVIEIFPNPQINFSMMTKLPGIHSILAPSKLNLTHKDTANVYQPDDYDRLLSDVVRGKRTAFLRADEKLAGIKIFEHALNAMQVERIRPYVYAPKSDGPEANKVLLERFRVQPEKDLCDEEQRTTEAMKQLKYQFNISPRRMIQLVNNFLKEFSAGLEGKPSSIKMLPAYVQHLPTGDETGVYYALDLGGTNFRVSRFELLGQGDAKLTDERKFTVPDSCMTGESADVLFDFLAECISQVSSPEDGPEGGKYGFTFSFPVQQISINSGKLLHWTKAFKTKGVEGEEVVALLKKALKKRGFKAQIVALVNDTVGTLAAKAYTSPKCRIGLIIGTGTNAAYIERVENIKTIPKELRDQGGDMIINTEWGGFGSKGSGLLPVTDVDMTLDKMSRNPTEQSFEKMISGYYLGEITRLCLMQLVDESKVLWQSCTVPDSLREAYSFQSRYMSDVEYDMSATLEVVQHVEAAHGVEGSTLQDRRIVQQVCAMVVERAARLTACGIAAAVRQLDDRGMGSSVGIDGSVFENHPSFGKRLNEALRGLGCVVEVGLSKDGSGKGAALIACGVDVYTSK